MGEFFEDSMSAMKYGFSWYKDMENWKSYGLYVLANFLLYGIIIALFFPIFSAFATSTIPRSSPFLSAEYMLFLVASLLTVFVLFWIFQMYIFGGVIVRGLNGANVASKTASFSKTNGAIILTLIQAFQTYFMWYDKKWLGVLFVAIILPFFSMWLLGISILLFFAYICALIYMSLRLSMSLYVYFSTEEISYSHAIETSYALTRGMVTSMASRLIVAGLIASILIGIATLIPRIFLMILDAVIGFQLFQTIFDIIISPIQIFTGLYISAYVYALLLGWNKERLGRMPSVKMRSTGK